MFLSTIKTAVRNLRKDKGYSLINLTGLALGMAACLLILLWIGDELSFDRFHRNASRIHRVVYEEKTPEGLDLNWMTPYPLAEALNREFPEILEAAAWCTRRDLLLRRGESSFKALGSFTDPAALEIFTIAFEEGDPGTALADPNAVIITRDLAERIFADTEPVGQILNFNNQRELTVTAVVAALPANSTLQFDFLVNFKLLNDIYDLRDLTESWRILGFDTFVLVDHLTDRPELDIKIADFYRRHETSKDLRLYLQPLSQLHLHPLEGPGRSQYIYLFSILAILVLMIACINFMNLATARSARRAREVGLRKVIGARRSGIIIQFFSEALGMAFLALLFSIGLVELMLPAFSHMVGKELSLNLLSTEWLLGLPLIILLTGLLAGSYPALYLSSAQPGAALRGPIRSASSWFRKSLVIIQTTVSIILIVAIAVVHSQLKFMQGKDMGFKKQNLVFLPLNDEIDGGWDAFKQELIGIPGITSITQSSTLVGIRTTLSGIRAEWEGKTADQDLYFHVISVDYDAIRTFGMELIEGRDFSQEFAEDHLNVILNQEAVRRMGVQAPIDRRFSLPGMEGRIIGIVRDFHLYSLHDAIEPIIIMMAAGWNRHVALRIDPENTSATIAAVGKTWERFTPSFPFEYRFLDQDFEVLYRLEARLSGILRAFALFAVFISCLGLFGLSAFTAERRTKEIGIRKVLGASAAGIVSLLSREFARWVLAANLIAWPAAYVAASFWLRGFAYRTHIHPFIFIGAGLLSLLITLAAVGSQTLRAALADPVESLHYE